MNPRSLPSIQSDIQFLVNFNKLLNVFEIERSTAMAYCPDYFRLDEPTRARETRSRRSSKQSDPHVGAGQHFRFSNRLPTRLVAGWHDSSAQTLRTAYEHWPQ